MSILPARVLVDQASRRERIGHRFGALLANGMALLRRHRGSIALDVVQHSKEFQGLLGDLALIGHVQVEELAACVCHAADFGHTLLESCLVAAVITADQLTLPTAEEGARVNTGTAGGKVVDNCLQ